MAAWWKKTGGSRQLGSVAPGSILFPRIDKEHVRRKVNLGRNAKIDGHNDDPQEGTSDLSSTELNVLRYCQDQLSEYERAFSRERDSYVERRNSALSLLKVDSEELKEQAMVDGVVADWTKRVGPITSSARDLTNYGEQLRNFRTKHDLWGRLPDCKSAWRLMWVLLAIFVVELFATAFLLRETGGLLLVLIISVGYCVLNCALPFGLGPVFRWKNYNRKPKIRKLGGWAAMLLALGSGLALNLLMGHYRSAGIELRSVDTAGANLEFVEEMSQAVDSVSIKALQNFLASPFGIVDTLSWLLAAVGFFVFLISFSDGYKKDDIYPDYGKYYKRYREQLNEYHIDVEKLIDVLRSRRDGEVKRIVARREEMKHSLENAVRLENYIASLEQRYDHACDVLDTDCQELVREYRKINQAARTSPTPAYFSREEKLQIAKPAIPGLPEAPDENEVQKRIQKLANFSQRLNDEFDNLTAKIKPSNEILTPPPDVIIQEPY